jgi:hypothetical protein
VDKASAASILWRGGKTRPYGSMVASYTPPGGPRTASGVQNGVFQTSAEL